MTKSERTAIMALPLVLLAGAGLGWAGSQSSAGFSGIPILALALALAFVIQWIAFIPAFALKTERFYDLVGSVTYTGVAIVAVVLSGRADARSLLLLSLIIVWAARLGSFLFLRVRRAGRDERFEEIKRSFPRFLMAWSLQGLWVSFTLAAALAAITTARPAPLGAVAWIGVALWLAGFAIESIADEQKRRFRARPSQRGEFIRSGLWAWSRHPNYFGEILLWIGVAVIAMPTLCGWRWATLISPLFVILLLTRISGIPILERRADARWGEREDYQTYKRRTSVLIPWPPKR
jgi:steroid 5-alpha reductase family enzyme